MKIIKIDFWHEDLNLKKPYTISYETIDFVENIFFKIELEDGTWGIGAGSPAEFVTGENIKNSISLLKKTSKELFLNKDINSFESIIDSLNKYGHTSHILIDSIMDVGRIHNQRIKTDIQMQ